MSAVSPSASRGLGGRAKSSTMRREIDLSQACERDISHT
jgi:hypothetical protein